MDQKISQLTTKATPVANDTTVIVDSAAPTTNKKVTLDSLPISSATQSALNAKANDNAVVKLTGNQSVAGVKTFTDDIHLEKTTGTARVLISSGAATDPKILSFRTASVQRWAFRVDGAGDNLAVRRYDDSGAFIDAPVTIDRSTGVATINGSTMSAKANLSGGNSFSGAQSFGDSPISRFSAEVVTVISFPYTLQDSDNGKILRFNTGSNSQVNLPNNLPAGFNIAWSQAGSGVITFSPAIGATMNNRQSHTKSAGQHAMGSLVVMTNTGSNAMYNLSGDTQA